MSALAPSDAPDAPDAPDPWTRLMRRATALAVVLHLSVAAVAIFGPKLFSQEEPPMRYVSVQVVPLQALGQETPVESPRRPEPPAPPPEPPPPEPPPERVEPPPPDPELPVLPPPKPQPVPTAPPPPPQPQPIVPEPALPTPSREGSPQGDARATSAFGASVAGLDDPDFTYSYYIDSMLAAIRSHWTRPPVGRGVEGVVHFRILKDGRVEDLRLITSSGRESFDRAALRAVSNASPLPPLPAGYRKEHLGVRLTLR
jgi:protein TonB